MAKKQIIPIKDAFSKLMIDGHGRNKLPTNYASYVRNARIENQSLTVRKGYKIVVQDASGTHIRGITSNEINPSIVVSSNSYLKKVDVTAGTLTNIGPLIGDADVNMFNHGKYTMILTGTSNPYVYDGNTLFKLGDTSYNSAKVTSGDAVTKLITAAYTPGYLTGGNAATSVIATWQAVTDGTFRITIDGVVINITGLNFSTDTLMTQVAARIQAAIRNATMSLETVQWSTDKFIIKSVNTTVASAVSVTSAQGTGTDISGAGATAFMDAETGRGIATAAVILPAWKTVTAGSFAITIDGIARNIVGLNFSAVTNLTDVAAVIQAGIRAVTLGLETCEVNSIGSFVIRSASHTSASAITVTSAVSPATGTDISGAATNAYMDMETGRGTVVNAAVIKSPEVNPLLGTAYSGFTVIAGNTPETSNYIYFSRPVTISNPEYCYDWVGSGSESKNMQSKVLGLTSSLNNLFIFTQRTVEYVDKNSLSTIGGTFSFYSSPIGDGDQLLNYRMAVTANDRAFYMTKNLEIKTLNYIQGTVNPSIGQLSDRPLLSIKNFVETQLHQDQSGAFAIRKEDKIFRYMRSYDSPFNDIALFYDLTNDTWGVDNGLFYSSMTKYNGLYYAGSALNSNIYQDDLNYDDDQVITPFEYLTVPMNFGNPVKRKLYKGYELAGEINKETKLEISMLIDGQIVQTDYVDGADYFVPIIGGIGNNPVGGEAIGGDFPVINTEFVHFEKCFDNVSLKGKNIQFYIKNSTVGGRFYLDYLAPILIPVGNYILSDK